MQGVRPTHTHQLYFCVVCRGRVNTAGPTNPGEKGLPTRLDVGRAPTPLTSKKREAHGARSCVPTVQVAELLLSSGVWKVGMCQAEGAHVTFHCTSHSRDRAGSCESYGITEPTGGLGSQRESGIRWHCDP